MLLEVSEVLEISFPVHCYCTYSEEGADDAALDVRAVTGSFGDTSGVMIRAEV